jgi:hypothetical protein
MPNRDYWLSPERKRETLNYIACSMAWMGSATLLFVMRIFHGCFEAALGPAATPTYPLPSPGVAGALYGACLLAFCVGFFVRFRKKESQ